MADKKSEQPKGHGNWCYCAKCKEHFSTKKPAKASTMKEFFAIDEASQLAAQAKNALPTPVTTLLQQDKAADKNKMQTLKQVSSVPGTVVKQGKTDPANPISNVFVTQQGKGTQVVDNQTGQLKDVPGLDQDKTKGPMGTTGVMGTQPM